MFDMSVRERLKAISKQLGIYNTIRYSKTYFKILKYKNPGYIQSLYDDLAFYRLAVGESMNLVFDIGANNGDKAWVFRQIAHRVVCFEPDEAAFAALRARYGRDRCVSLENVALGAERGTGYFFVEQDGSCWNTLSEKERDWLASTRAATIQRKEVPISTLDEMIARHGAPHYLKIDVEGFELPVLNGLSCPIPVISFEANLPRFREETLRIMERFADNERVRVNLRLKDRFVFQTHRSVEEALETLRDDREITYDIFVYDDTAV